MVLSELTFPSFPSTESRAALMPSPAPIPTSAIRLCPHACPISGRASYSHRTATWGPEALLPTVALQTRNVQKLSSRSDRRDTTRHKQDSMLKSLLFKSLCVHTPVFRMWFPWTFQMFQSDSKREQRTWTQCQWCICAARGTLRFRENWWEDRALWTPAAPVLDSPTAPDLSARPNNLSITLMFVCWMHTVKIGQYRNEKLDKSQLSWINGLPPIDFSSATRNKLEAYYIVSFYSRLHKFVIGWALQISTLIFRCCWNKLNLRTLCRSLALASIVSHAIFFRTAMSSAISPFFRFLFSRKGLSAWELIQATFKSTKQPFANLDLWYLWCRKVEHKKIKDRLAHCLFGKARHPGPSRLGHPGPSRPVGYVGSSPRNWVSARVTPAECPGLLQCRSNPRLCEQPSLHQTNSPPLPNQTKPRLRIGREPSGVIRGFKQSEKNRSFAAPTKSLLCYKEPRADQSEHLNTLIHVHMRVRTCQFVWPNRRPGKEVGSWPLTDLTASQGAFISGSTGNEEQRRKQDQSSGEEKKHQTTIIIPFHLGFPQESVKINHFSVEICPRKIFREKFMYPSLKKKQEAVQFWNYLKLFSSLMSIYE